MINFSWGGPSRSWIDLDGILMDGWQILDWLIMYVSLDTSFFCTYGDVFCSWIVRLCVEFGGGFRFFSFFLSFFFW